MLNGEIVIAIGGLNHGVNIIRWDFNEGFLFQVAHRINLPLDGVRIRYRPFERQMPVDT
jgi:hypothetical protein